MKRRAWIKCVLLALMGTVSASASRFWHRRIVAVAQLNSTLSNIAVANGGGDSFEAYTEESPITQSLSAGNGWNGAWNVVPNDTGYNGVSSGAEDFQSYADGAVGTMNGGTGWNGAWNIENLGA